METQFPTVSYGVVFLFQRTRDEDSKLVYDVYENIRKKARFSIDIVQQDGLLRATGKLLLCNLVTFLTGGRTFVAVINNYPFALTTRIFPLVRICTYDDGAHNINLRSPYYSEIPLSGHNLRRRWARVLFPKGCAFWVRKKTRQHFTIFPEAANIVSTDRLFRLSWSWRDFLFEEDLHRLPLVARAILLGAPFDDLAVPQQAMEKAKAMLDQVDLYIMHPRERAWIDCAKMVRLKSPAEAVLELMAARGPLTVYHFGSTVGYALRHHHKIKFNDLLNTDGQSNLMTTPAGVFGA
jgi:N-acetyllactosaminide alpha-2,3-sialyltransferase